MRILLAQNSLYYPAHGGGDRSNRLLLEALAERGHDCQVVARVDTRFGEEQHRRYLRQLAKRRIGGVSTENGVVRFPHHGVDVHAATSHPNFRGYFSQQLQRFRPRAVILSTDDPAQMLLAAALDSQHARVVYLTRTTLALPFGPDCAFPSVEKTERLRQTDGVIGVSEYVASYIRKWSGIDSGALPISLLEAGPWPDFGSFEGEYVTLANPCAVKGISILLAMARQMPQVKFAAVPTWGTTAEDKAALSELPNIDLIDPVDDIDDLFKRTRVLLVPSLWAEARSRIVVEAMLRGVPVIASDVGGIPEAMMGVDYLLPVRPIVHYRAALDDQMVPVAEVPEQGVALWVDALTRLTTDRDHYTELSATSRAAALHYANKLSVRPFEEYLEGVVGRPRNPLRRWEKTPPTGIVPVTGSDALSPEKRALLALRLKKRTAAATAPDSLWFPNIAQSADARLRLFCFPYAGGGTSVFRNWQKHMPEGVSVIPARPPGRESRTHEQPIDRISEMADSVLEAVRPHLDKPFAFFGHSMGAMISFELARALRRHKFPMPAALFVAGARAPQFRRDHVPSPVPADEEFLREIRELEGAPREVLENDELLKYLLPALKADSVLGQMYVYHDEPPLDIPIHAYVGSDDPRLPRDVIEPWQLQTTATFTSRDFPGTHFFIHTAEEQFLNALAEGVAGLVAEDPNLIP
jgi:surfactin synthase thioesterase subunit/glycosyltransferase involved in cell wall biosynthesis